ncbi:MAG TPA: alanine--tRNA ligase [Spirochaetota bacterium]|nr:alanine--tRNA ligase [Spirochaetota bacterium]
MLRVKDLRESFTNFFREREHRIIPSSSLVPKDDPTLLFTTAGMVQFKSMFAGTVRLDYTRAATVQKCFRTSDLERVGKTKRHCTFFEMLGNFSFGDYFKKEAIEYAWEYSTKVVGFPVEDVWISIFESDDEAFDIWHRHIGVHERKIVRLGREDNFWGPAGDSGACGPCSELYLDRGPAFGCGSADCRPGCDCERFLEFWNLVFNQFYQDKTGKQTPLPRPGIDTGMGLERLATLVQNVDSIYGTDELRGMVDFVCREATVQYEGDIVAPVNVLVEHARALTFAISDGAYPSNEGRGYVLRRILRRALRFARQIGITGPFLYKMIDPLVEKMGPYYPEIVSGAPNVKNVLEGEEKRFLETLENGMDRLEEAIKAAKSDGGNTLSGKDAFMLYDTFGFPLEMTVEMAGENGIVVDTGEFDREMEKQRERGKQSWKSGEAGSEKILEALSADAGPSGFLGYDENVTSSEILALAGVCGAVKKLDTGERGFLVARESTFYGESGGQTGDRGAITGYNGAVFRVDDTKKLNGTIIHLGEVIQGAFAVGDRVTMEIDLLRRNLTRANHTATHLLQAALRKVLGAHVHQTGSLVEPERMRFDFTHFRALDAAEIAEIERIVNDVIWAWRPVETSVRPLDEAVKMGAMAVFDEKYEDVVRVVSVKGFSMELCGGTHADNTGKLGVFKILREASPGAGMRRIEAVTLRGVLERFGTQSEILSSIAAELNATEQDIPRKVHDALERARSLEKQLEKMKTESLASNFDDILTGAVVVKDTSVVQYQLKGPDIDELRRTADLVRSKLQNSVVCLGSEHEGRAILLCAATSAAVATGVDCGAIIKKASPLVGGGGGGRKDMAQAGGKSPDGLPRALKEAVETAKKMIGG